MNRRRFLRLAGLAPFAVAAGRLAAADKADRPNVLLIISDDQGWTDFGFMGHEIIRTPRLDRLATRSLLMTRGYVPTSLCRPSLATISTGLYPHQHRIVGNDPSRDKRTQQGRRPMIDRFGELPNLARLLGKAGYMSLQTGKWWEGSAVEAGFTEGMTHGVVKKGGRHGDVGLRIGREGIEPITQFLDAAKAADKPFFIWYAPFLPHTPHNPPKRLLEKYTAPGRARPLAKYYAMCEWFDETCGQVLDALADRALAENTLVAFVVDNGWVQSETGKREFFTLRHKRTPYEGGVRTPIMIHWPGKVTPRRDEKHLAGSIDLAPTILAACGLDAPSKLPGVNLLDADAAAERDTVFGEVFEHDVADLSAPAKSLTARWCVSDRWKLILHAPRTNHKPPAELYDILADPHEKANLAKDHPDVVARLSSLLNQWWEPKAP